MALRTACKTSSRAGTESFKTARFNVVVCRAHLGDIAAHPWIEMIRVGQFGYGSVPVIMLCDEIEFEQLAPMIDQETRLVREDDHQGLIDALRAIANSTDKTAVLVVEDQEQAADVVRRTMEKYYTVDIASDGASGLQLWRSRRHPVVILDLMLPELSGSEVLELMLKDDPEQIVIVLTAFDTPEKHEEIILAGAVKFASKNGDLHALPEICARALRAKKCMSNVRRSRAIAADMTEAAVQIHAATCRIQQGQAAHGLQHVRLAAFGTRAAQITDDQVARILDTSNAPPD
jgi:DNA-binding response OmpR family regulator